MAGDQERGIIPAYAGSTGRRTARSRPKSDHPRIRGEHFTRRSKITLIVGSSPHTRGARFLDKGSQFVYRIIPAYAGSTLGSLPSGTACPDHPRIRGEHLLPDNTSISYRGSSPHTRGARSARSRPSPGPGIIPAYAGSTNKPRIPRSEVRDHPRIRGEHGPSR